MDLAARPHITAGVALASAAVIAAGPMAQHLPDLHLAQQLRTVSVTEIQLTDAASSVIDLFAGVENELASLASGAAVASVPAATVGVFINPITTWANVLQTAANNIGLLGQKWLADPLPVASQVVINELGFGNILAKAINTAGTSFWNSLARPATGVAARMFTAGTDLAAGNLFGAVNTWTSLELSLILSAGENFVPALALVGDIATNFGKLVTELSSTQVLFDTSLISIEYFGAIVPDAFALTAQGVINAVQAGDPAGALSAIVNAPANLTGNLLNGFFNPISGSTLTGLLSTSPSNGGVLSSFGLVPPLLAQSIGAKAGQNTSSLLPGAFNTFGSTVQTQLTSLWNTMTTDLGTIFSQTFPSLGGLATALQGVPAALAPLGSLIGNFTGQVGSALGNIGAQIGTLLLTLLKAL
ncbi:hypothetical protein H7H82_19705 [Mycobacterium heidelbergense]|uniref:hypothetical protein n=1 Tax=Mycobacterium heidelbergense TaxID=53376 RepID=UPI001150A0AA|nr:hypothetical protein [Mycobacterium heidelbergense]MCV7052789.1 hypothetical protein [Mycobacterium heidelbergense]BBZ49960.1 hypothetical protein MHEI_16770 [Mycobacterium heidelbergense]